MNLLNTYDPKLPRDWHHRIGINDNVAWLELPDVRRARAILNVLVTYNAEVNRGLQHTQKWDAQMHRLQQEWVDWQLQRNSPEALR